MKRHIDGYVFTKAKTAREHAVRIRAACRSVQGRAMQGDQPAEAIRRLAPLARKPLASVLTLWVRRP